MSNPEDENLRSENGEDHAVIADAQFSQTGKIAMKQRVAVCSYGEVLF